MGLEPTTSAVTGRRSNQLNYQAIGLDASLRAVYLLETSGRIELPAIGAFQSQSYGGSYRARTYDPLLVRQMLSQLS